MTTRRAAALSALLAIGFAGWYLFDLSSVPFFPDESTYIFMSRDFATAFLKGDPSALAWRLGEPLTFEARYRLRDGAVPRDLIGLSLWLHGYSAAEVNADWAWDQPWQANVLNRQIPQPGVLRASRVPSAVLAALTAVLIFWIGASVRGPSVGLTAALAFGLSPMMLLHARRAMAEGPLLFFSAASVLAGLYLAGSIERWAQARWRRLALFGLAVGVLIGLTVSTKHTGAVIAPVAALPLSVTLGQKRWPLAQRLSALALMHLAMFSTAALVFFLLNPVLFRAPFETARAMLAARTTLLAGQTATLQVVAPEQLLPTPPSRLQAAIAALFFRPVAAWDVLLDNQVDYFTTPAQVYFAQPLHQNLPALGAVWIALTVLGASASAARLIRSHFGAATRAEQTVWIWGMAALGLVLMIPFDWQRYFLPLFPPVCLFAALGVEPLLNRLPHRVPIPPSKAYDSV